jgi:hypothetical protein
MSSIFGDILDSFGGLFYTDDKFDLAKAGGVGAALANVFGGGISGSNPPYGVRGYEGGVPSYTAIRQRVPNTNDPNRRAGSGGRRYFTDTQYAISPKVTPKTIEEARAIASAQAQQLAQKPQGLGSITPPPSPVPTMSPTPMPMMTAPITPSAFAAKPSTGPKMGTGSSTPPVAIPQQNVETPRVGGVDSLERLAGFATGGLAGLKKAKYLNGATDGMADRIPATIDKTQPAALSDGEFVIPADVVSHLGNGNSDAGAKVLSDMMDRVRMARTGSKKQGKEINPNKFLPKV